MSGPPAPIPLMRALVAALWLGTGLAQAALAADQEMCPKDSPLGGWVRMQHLAQKRLGDGGCDQVTNVFMTFDLVPDGPSLEQLTAHLPPQLPPQVRQQLVNGMLAARAGLGRKATKLKYKIWTDGCHDIGGDHFTCSAPGGAGSGELALGEETPTGFKPSMQQAQGGGVSVVIFNPMVPSLEIRTLSAAGESLLHPFGGMCVSTPRNSGAGRSDFISYSDGFEGLGVTIEPEPNCKFCTAPTACFKPTDDAQRRECVINPGKFAVLPFEGNLEHRFSPFHDDGIVFTKVSWKLCCGCGQEPPPPDFPNKPCPDTAGIDATLATNRAKEAALTADLATLWKSYEEEMSKAQSHLQQFQTTMRACNIQNKLTELLAGTLGLFSPAGEAAIAAESAEEAEAIKQAVEMLGPQIGDPASTLFTVISKLMSNEDPTAKLIPSETYQTYLEALEVAEKVITSINGSSVAQLEEQVQGCAGTIGLSDETWKGANEYIEDLKAAMANVPASQVLVNDIRKLDTELPDLQYQDYAACVRRARCLKQPESGCDKLKPAGNWPDVQ